MQTGKTTIIISIILCFSMTHHSCKVQTVINTGCVTVIQAAPATPLLPASEMNVIHTLFNSNRMDFTNYQFYQFDTDELGFKHARSYQFVNGLKVFSEELIFHFNQYDSCYLVSGNVINSTGLDAKPLLTPNKVVELFIQKMAQEKASMAETSSVQECFEIEFGYVALDESNKHFAKAWKAKPADKAYPYAYIKDDSAEIIYYDNGIRY